MTEQEYDIHKAALVIIEDRKVILTRSKGKTVYVNPGGKLEPGESSIDAAIREAKEELTIDISKEDLELIGTFYAIAAGSESNRLKMDVWRLNSYRGTISPSNEIAEIKRVNTDIPKGLEIGSIFLHDILPRLKSEDLID